MLITATIADIHFNAIKPDKIFEQLDYIFLEYLRNNKVDLVVIAGDFYHSIISLNSFAAKLSMEFMNNLISVAKKSGINFIRIIKGTSSHDNNQLENFRIFEKQNDVNFKIFDTVTEEILSGYRILYLPEEYTKNVDEFYGDYFNKKYDIIFGHGMFRETSFDANKQESGITLSKAPIFESSKFCEMTNGPILFGHIHKHCVIHDRITYIGSFSRWVYGEEEPKGFVITRLTKDSYTNEFIENIMAERYDTIKMINPVKFKDNPELFIAEMKTFIKDHLRIVLILTAKVDFSYFISFLREYYSKKPEYKLVIIDESEIVKQEEQEKKIDELMEKYKFIFDNSISRTEKISKFIKIRDKVEISIDRIEDVLKLK